MTMNNKTHLTTGKRVAPALITAAVCVSFAAFAGNSGHSPAVEPEVLSSHAVMDKQAGYDLDLMIFIHRGDAGMQAPIRSVGQ
ncbi:hypothetical protein CEW83_13005 [Parazoarcus communis]|uniref:Uncharacterized protein n=1 Tax=Parazoarcus communis TaxID=41977 RepID=A0A2U8GR83_9RHOO|nr:hypothetical protein [Parazoarcus communis]AWI76024.1 hypothetical protein CEW83_13005 [Parazoarcus communis]